MTYRSLRHGVFTRSYLFFGSNFSDALLTQ
jgi:hypothetical protein